MRSSLKPLEVMDDLHDNRTLQRRPARSGWLSRLILISREGAYSSLPPTSFPLLKLPASAIIKLSSTHMPLLSLEFRHSQGVETCNVEKSRGLQVPDGVWPRGAAQSGHWQGGLVRSSIVGKEGPCMQNSVYPIAWTLKLHSVCRCEGPDCIACSLFVRIPSKFVLWSKSVGTMAMCARIGLVRDSLRWLVKPSSSDGNGSWCLWTLAHRVVELEYEITWSVCNKASKTGLGSNQQAVLARGLMFEGIGNSWYSVDLMVSGA